MSSPVVPGWSKLPLSELIERKFTGPSPTCEERPIATSEEWGLLKTTAITWSGWNENAHKVPPKTFWGNESIEVKPGDVLITKAGPRHRVGVVVHVASTRPHLMVSGKMVGLRPKTLKVMPSLLAGLLSTQDAQNYLNSRTTGMAESQTNFADEALLQAQLNVPSMPEQRRIAEILDTLDDQIRAIGQVIAKLKLVKQGLIDNFLTYGIAENGMVRSAYEVEGNYYSPSGYLPSNWELAECGELCRDITVGIVVRPTQYYRPLGIPMLRSANVREEGLELTDLVYMSPADHALMSKSAVGPGDLVTVRTGYPGTTCVVTDNVPAANCIDIIVSRPGPRVMPGYLALWVNSEFGKGQVLRNQGGLAQQHFNTSEMKALQVVVPTMTEQKTIVERVDKIDRRLSLEIQQAAKLKSLRRGLMSDVLKGYVRVPAEGTS